LILDGLASFHEISGSERMTILVDFANFAFILDCEAEHSVLRVSHGSDIKKVAGTLEAPQLQQSILLWLPVDKE
jgi:hypothetical protein